MSQLIQASSLSSTQRELELVREELVDYKPDPNVIITEGYNNDTSSEVYAFLKGLVDENEASIN